ncbi:cation:proton antiporter [Halobacteriales archaeon Cl-PHB]
MAAAGPLLEFAVVLAALAVAGAVALRVGISVIPLYIVAGIVVGPYEPTALGPVSLTLVAEGPALDLLAELGVIFLLFFLGLEFSVDRLLADRGRIGRAGLVDFALNFGAGLLLGVLIGWGLVPTLFLAGVVYISSSAIVTKSLIDQGWVANPEGDPILGTLVFEDILIAIYLAVLGALVLGSGGLEGAAMAVGRAFLFLGVLVVVAWYGSAWLERAVGVSSDEQFLLRVLAVTTVVAGAALALGVSEAVAAFFVGTAFSQTDLVERLEHVVAPARDVFAAIFFFAIGLTIDVTLLAGVLGLLAAAVLLTTATKLVSGTLSGRVYGLDRRRSLRVGLGLVPRGEFSLVIATLAAGQPGVVGEVIPAFAVGYVLVMSLLGTVLIEYADAVTDRLAPVSPRETAAD